MAKKLSENYLKKMKMPSIYVGIVKIGIFAIVHLKDIDPGLHSLPVSQVYMNHFMRQPVF